MSDSLWRLLTLQDPNTRVVLLGTVLLGMAAGLIGALAVLRRRALMGDALAHATLPGICLAFLVIGEKSMPALMLGAMLTGGLGVLVVVFLRRYTRIKEDAAIGIVLSVFFGVGICLTRYIQKRPTGNRAGLQSFLFGKANAMIWQDVYWIAIAAAIVLIGVLLLYKEFRLLCFDREFAGAQGWPVITLDVILMTLLVICTVIGLPAVGVVLMAALLIIPSAAARFWSDKLHHMLVIAAMLGGGAGLLGTAASAVDPNLATGPSIVLTAALAFTISVLFAPRRGVIADTVRRAQLRRRVGLQNLLRTLFELSERSQGVQKGFTADAIYAARGWTRSHVARQLRRAAAHGLVAELHGHWRLTETGWEEARRVVRAHRLWEMFLVHQAAVAPDHVDRDADEIEHVLSPDVIAQLEERLRASRRPAGRDDVPSSPHVLGESAV